MGEDAQLLVLFGKDRPKLQRRSLADDSKRVQGAAEVELGVRDDVVMPVGEVAVELEPPPDRGGVSRAERIAGKTLADDPTCQGQERACRESPQGRAEGQAGELVDAVVEDHGCGRQGAAGENLGLVERGATPPRNMTDESDWKEEVEVDEGRNRVEYQDPDDGLGNDAPDEEDDGPQAS